MTIRVRSFAVGTSIVTVVTLEDTRGHRRLRLGALGLLASIDLLPPGVLAALGVGSTVARGPGATAVTLGLFGIAFFEVADRSHRSQAAIPTSALGYRLLFALCALGVFVTVAPYERLADLWAVLLVTAVAVVGFPAYLVVVHGWTVLDTDGQAVRVFDAYAPRSVVDELRTDIERSGVLGRLSSLLLLVGFGTLLALPSFLAGYIGRLLTFAAPVPDLLVLCWLAAVTLRGRLGDGDRTGSADALDERFYAVAATVGRSTVGTYTGFLATFGLFGTVLMVAATVRLTELFVSTVGDAGGVIVWYTLGYLVVTAVAGLYGLWGWLRLFERLPPSPADTDAIPTRPVGHSVVAPGSVLLVSLAIAGLTTAAGRLLWTVWPLLPYAICVAWGVTRTRETQPLDRETRVVTVASVCHVVGVLVALDPTALVALRSGTLPAELLWPSLLCLVVLGGLGLLAETSGRRDGVGRYAFPVVMCSVAVVCLVLLGVESHVPPVLLGGLAITAGVGGLAVAVTRYYDL